MREQVVVDGQDLATLPDRAHSRMRAERIGFVFQFSSLVPTLNVLVNVLLPHASHVFRLERGVLTAHRGS